MEYLSFFTVHQLVQLIKEVIQSELSKLSQSNIHAGIKYSKTQSLQHTSVLARRGKRSNDNGGITVVYPWYARGVRRTGALGLRFLFCFEGKQLCF